MKITKLLSLSLAGLLICSFSLQAQIPYTCVTKGTTLEYANYNDSDQLENYTRQVIKDVSDLSGGSYDIRVENSVIKKPGQKKAGDEVFVTVSEVRDASVHAYPMNSEGTIDVIENREALLLPSKVTVGYQLPIGEIRIDLGGISTVATLTENEIIGREEVETSAGSFRCYVLRQTVATNMIGMALTTTTKSWYCRGVGIVKSETMMGGRLVRRMELVTYEEASPKGKK
ncbi:MAG: hypothetical protein MJZ16_00525 [Bacteroidales bacterium]|nr:hypothetical protein [Bacteroidales bacterium]